MSAKAHSPSAPVPHECTTHQFIRKGTKHHKTRDGNTLYMCAHPRCFTVMDRLAIVGKESMCNRCGAVFILDRVTLQLAKPLCLLCANTKKAKQYRKSAAVVRQLFSDPEETNPLKDQADGI